MKVIQNASLANYSTMGLGGTAAYVAEITTRMELLEALSWAEKNNLPAMMIGGGSNIVWRDEGFPGLLLINKVVRFEVFEEDDLNVYVTIGAGENWDAAVARCVAAGYTGIEALSLIPGTAGATPIQNVGAYGQEIAQTLVTIEAFDTQARDFVTIAAPDCNFGYRTSRFKTTDKGRFYIMSITLHLTKGNPQPPFYKTLASYLNEHGISEYTPAVIRDAVIAVRQSRLPDPAVVKNNGSFFANPIVDEGVLTQLVADLDGEVPHWSAGPGKIKLSAAWLIEQAGFSNHKDPETGMATWPAQALVLVNEHAPNTAALLAYKHKIVSTVAEKFGVTLEQEPELLP